MTLDVLFTNLSGSAGSTAERAALAQLQRAGIEAVSLELAPDSGPLRAGWAADLMRSRASSLARAAVIAQSPRDADLLMEAGWAAALRGSGYRACAAADAVFPPRGADGLAQAVLYLARHVARA